MKIYKTQKEVEADIRDGVLALDESVTIACDVNLNASIRARGDIIARHITVAGDIVAGGSITTWDIKAGGNVMAQEYITAWGDIVAGGDVMAEDISYYAVCRVYGDIKCCTCSGRCKGASPAISLGGELKRGA